MLTNFYERPRIISYNSIARNNKRTLNTTLDQLFKFISLRLTGINKASDFIDAISGFQGGYYVDTQDALIVRNKYEQLDLIESFVGKDEVQMIRLTEAGKQIMNDLNRD